jgi:hypothetical protein
VIGPSRLLARECGKPLLVGWTRSILPIHTKSQAAIGPCCAKGTVVHLWDFFVRRRDESLSVWALWRSGASVHVFRTNDQPLPKTY